jgi:hypothetical protein
VQWITDNRGAPLIAVEILSNQMGPPLCFEFLAGKFIQFLAECSFITLQGIGRKRDVQDVTVPEYGWHYLLAAVPVLIDAHVDLVGKHSWNRTALNHYWNNPRALALDFLS